MHWLIDNWVELVGNALAFADIYLLYRNLVANWPVGILNSTFYIVLFFPAKLYADSFLQVVYIVLSLYGWWWWIGGRTHVAEPVRTYRDFGGGHRTYVEAFALFVLSALILALVVSRFTSSDVPVYDSLLTATCFAATFLMARRRVENWYFWIASNVGYFFLYGHKQLPITQWCQIGFLALSVFGLLNWLKEREKYLATHSPPAQPS